MTAWPCMLKLDGDNELIYLSSLAYFNLECCDLIFSDKDYVVDSQGQRYLIDSTLGELKLIPSGDVLRMEDITPLIQAHEFNKASVCLTKIQFLTASEAIKSLVV